MLQLCFTSYRPESIRFTIRLKMEVFFFRPFDVGFGNGVGVPGVCEWHPFKAGAGAGPRSRRVICAGHSRGGSVCELFAACAPGLKPPKAEGADEFPVVSMGFLWFPWVSLQIHGFPLFFHGFPMGFKHGRTQIKRRSGAALKVSKPTETDSQPNQSRWAADRCVRHGYATNLANHRSQAYRHLKLHDEIVLCWRSE